MSYCVLALDLATTTGWAIHKQGMARPFFGALRLPADVQEVGRPVEALRVLLGDLHKTHGPITDIIFEAQHVDAKINIDTVYRLIALGGMAEWFAYRIGARCFKIHISTWRKHFIGRGAAFAKGVDPKEMAIQKAEELGFYTEIADAAEAIGVLDYYLHQLAKADRTVQIPWRDSALLKTPGLFS